MLKLNIHVIYSYQVISETLWFLVVDGETSFVGYWFRQDRIADMDILAVYSFEHDWTLFYIRSVILP